MLSRWAVLGRWGDARQARRTNPRRRGLRGGRPLARRPPTCGPVRDRGHSSDDIDAVELPPRAIQPVMGTLQLRITPRREESPAAMSSVNHRVRLPMSIKPSLGRAHPQHLRRRQESATVPSGGGRGGSQGAPGRPTSPYWVDRC